MHLDIGQEVDGYRIESVLGRGGMGVVYKAEDIALSREVALKVINPSMSKDEQFVRRFQTEARTLAKVNSPNIVGIHAFRQTEHGLFIVMEYVDGGNLSDLLDGTPLAPDRAVSIMIQLLRGFEHAHGAGVIHRDIKPANIMVSRSGTVKVTDFGLAKMSQADMTKTMSQGVMGTLYYMSPEQVRGEVVDFRGDLWSLGVVFYELLTGSKPFEAAYEASVMYAIINEPVTFPDSIRATLPPGLDHVVERMLEKDKNDRYPDASAILVAIESLGIDGADTGTVERAQTVSHTVTKKGGKGLMIAGGALVILAAVFAVYLFFPGSSSSTDDSQRTGAALPALTLFTTPDSADVYVNDRAVGVTPVDQFTLDANVDTVRVRITKSGFERIDTLLGVDSPHHVYLTPFRNPPVSAPAAGGGTVRNRQAVEKEPAVLPKASISVQVIGRGAVRIDDGSRITGGSISVSPGKHTVRCISATGGESRQTLSLASGESRTLTCNLEAVVSVVSEPVWGYIYVNGRRTEFTTPYEFSLGPGTYRITVEKTGYGSSQMDGSMEAIQIGPIFGEQKRYRYSFRLTKN